MFVFPTSMTRSMLPIYHACRAARRRSRHARHSSSLIDPGLADGVPLGKGAPVAFRVADPRVLAVAVRIARARHEELARARVPPREGHAHVERAEWNGRRLAAQELPRAPEAVAIGIAELG